MARALEAAGFDGLWVADHVVLPALDRLALPLRGGRQGDLALGRPLRRGDDRPRARGLRHRARDARHGGAGAAAALTGDVREAGRLDRRRQQRTPAPRRRRRLAAGGVRGARRAVRRPRAAHRGVDRDRTRLLDRDTFSAHVRALHAARQHPDGAAAGAPDPVPHGRPLPRRAHARGPRGRRVARTAVAAGDRHGRARDRSRPDARDGHDRGA